MLSVSFITAKPTFSCAISDKEARASTKIFCNKMGIIFSQEPWVMETDYVWRIDNSEVKEVAFGERGDYRGFIKVSCNDKEVVFYLNSELRNQIQKKFKISSITTEPHNWPPFLSEEKAKEIIFSIAKKIGSPPDVEFYQLGLDKENGIWSGNWIRKHNGYIYEKDGIRIEIMAVDGEFYSYSKSYYGKPCPTDVKVNKEDAINEGWQQIYRLFKEVNWNKQKPDYEIKSAELKIVQPNTLAGKIITHHSTESRLAWVVVYGLKIKPDRYKLAEVSYLQRMTIKIDAATKKFLGGGYTQ